MKPTKINPKILTDREKKEINKMFGININEDLSLFKADFEKTRGHIRQIEARKLKSRNDLPDDIE